MQSTCLMSISWHHMASHESYGYVTYMWHYVTYVWFMCLQTSCGDPCRTLVSCPRHSWFEVLLGCVAVAVAALMLASAPRTLRVGAAMIRMKLGAKEWKNGKHNMARWSWLHDVAWIFFVIITYWLLVIGCYAFKAWVSRLAQTQETEGTESQATLAAQSWQPLNTILTHIPAENQNHSYPFTIRWTKCEGSGEKHLETSWNPFFSICGDVPHSWLAWPVSWQRWELSQKVMLQGSFKIASLKTWKEDLQVASEILMLTLKYFTSKETKVGFTATLV